MYKPYETGLTQIVRKQENKKFSKKIYFAII